MQSVLSPFVTQLCITSGIYSSAAVVQVELLWHKFSCRGTSTACPGKPVQARYGAAVPWAAHDNTPRWFISVLACIFGLPLLNSYIRGSPTIYQLDTATSSYDPNCWGPTLTKAGLKHPISGVGSICALSPAGPCPCPCCGSRPVPRAGRSAVGPPAAAAALPHTCSTAQHSTARHASCKRLLQKEANKAVHVQQSCA
jgi:hypothetical protein